MAYGKTAAGRTTYTFDPNGNQQVETAPDLSRTTTVWDYENQPRATQLPDGSRTTFVYNADFRLVHTKK